MRLTVFGATGGTGVEIVRQALGAGHEVTAVVRDPSRLPAELRERADVVQADVLDPTAIEAAVKGRDAVLSALGPRGKGPTTICADGIRSIAAACEAAGARRILMVSASGLAADAGDGPLTRYVAKPLIVQRLLRHAFADMRDAEARLGGSGLDWTIVRPPRLLDKPGKGTYRKATDLNVRRGFHIPRADLATALLDLVGDRASVRHIVSVAT
ncbi:NAD(P)-dependent oxidoreductase [Actinomadura sp. 9N407]|uniref:NAD(P)-dependent oxidoreductase n=1 Tax=Actinomadura sp. 9N407 TaxID=3375154 RepID=UPI0037B1B70D